MNTDIVPQTQQNAVEAALVMGDLSKLSQQERIAYYRSTCQSLGLNPLTKPFDYISLNGKLTLYARKDATDQLRRLRGVSIGKPDITFQEDWIIVTVEAKDKDGRTDSDVGMVNRKDMRGDFGNAVMKAVTKAKRRVTLSICGLGMLDETEVETIPDARPAPMAIESPAMEVQRTAPVLTGDPVVDLFAPAASYPKPVASHPMNGDQSTPPERSAGQCEVHDVPLEWKWSTKSNKWYPYHLDGNGKFCFGHAQSSAGR